MKEKLGVLGVAKVKGRAQDEANEVVVMVEAKAEEAAMGELHLLEGLEPFHEALLQLQGHAAMLCYAMVISFCSQNKTESPFKHNTMDFLGCAEK
ncbi:LTA synthase family protein [Sesbania bispinosa]|nr:LTA synthase family protein [Sesbania bispinosa]